MRTAIAPNTTSRPPHHANAITIASDVTSPAASSRSAAEICDTGWLRTNRPSQSGNAWAGAMPVDSITSSNCGTSSVWLTDR